MTNRKRRNAKAEHAVPSPRLHCQRNMLLPRHDAGGSSPLVSYDNLPLAQSSSASSRESPSEDVTADPHMETETEIFALSKRGRKRRVTIAALQMLAVFLVSTLIMALILWLAWPRLESEDHDKLRFPKSFDDLKMLNALLQKYRDLYPLRILICFAVIYLFIQAFSIPGSMYLSILAGAVWGVPIALPFACTCVATGATLCFLLSSVLGPALASIPWFARKLETWSSKIKSAAQEGNLISYLIILRISPLPPHWVVNILAPHVGIGLWTFWISTWLGIFGVTVIHTTIGGGLNEMTSANDFHILSVKNVLGLGVIVLAAAVPVLLRKYYGKSPEVANQIIEEESVHLLSLEDSEQGHSKSLLISTVSSDDEDGDEDIVLPGMRTQ